MNKKMKREWSQPKIEAVDLKFDKVMVAACYGSYNTPQNQGACGYKETHAYSCWNSGHQ
ncbi:MAG: hypothetical protein R6V00_12905 [Candidatus Aminicenantes bacterium]